VLGTHTSLLMTFIRPSRRPAVNGVAVLGHCEVGIDERKLGVSFGEHFIRIVDAAKGFGEVIAYQFICVSI